MIEVRTLLPDYAVAYLHRRGSEEGLDRSTLLRTIVLREYRREVSPK